MHKRSLWYALTLAGLFLALASNGWSQNPPPTPITGCTTISAPGEYQFANDVTYSSTTGACLTVTAANALIDMNNFTLSGPGGSNTAVGVFFQGATLYSTILNGTVTGFGTGILSKALWVFYTNMSLLNNSQIGFSLQSQYNRFVQSRVSGNGQYGIEVNAAYGSVIEGNTVSNNGMYGVFILRGGDYRIVNNTLRDNGTAGVYMGCALQPTQIPCPISSSTHPVNETTLINNSTSGSVFGIAADQTASDNRIIGNTATRNSFFDLWDAFSDCGASVGVPVVWCTDTFRTASTSTTVSCIH